MGTRIRHIKTETRIVRGQPTAVPVLDDQGREIELFSIDIPADVEAAGGIPSSVDQTDPVAIEAFITEKRAELQAAADAAAEAERQAQAAINAEDERANAALQED